MDAKSENDYQDDGDERSQSPEENGNDRSRDNERERDRTRRGDRRRTDKPKGTGRRAPAERRIYVSNIPYEYKWQDLKDLFRNEVGEVAYVEMFNDENNRPRGCAIIEFESADMVQKAIDNMHRHELKGRKLVVKEDFDTERDKHGRIMKGSEGSHRSVVSRAVDFGMPNSDGGSGAKFGNTYGLSTVFLESLGISGPLVNRVFVANLDYKVEEKNLKDVFAMAGKVTSAEINKDQDGKSRGFGIIEFEHPVEAVQAISMLHNQVYHDRILSVRMDRVSEKRESSSSKLPPGLKGLGMGLGANGAPLSDVLRLPANPTNLGSSVSNIGGLGNVGMNNAGVGMGQMGSGLGGLAGMGNMDNNVGAMVGGLGMNNNMNSGMVGGLAGMAATSGNMGGMGVNNNMGVGMGMANNAMGGGGGSLMGMGGLAGSGGLGGTGGLGGSGGLAGSGSLAGSAGGLMGSGGLAGSAGLVGSGGLAGAAPAIGGGSGMMRGLANTMGNNLGNSGSNYGGYGGTSNSRDYNHTSYSGNYGGSSNQRGIVQISNLPMNYTWQSLRDLCREFGEIRFAEIRSKGMGNVRFQHESDARRAVLMLDRQRMEGRILDVRMA